MTATFEMHPNSALLSLVTTITPTQEKALWAITSVSHSQLPLEMGLTFKYTSGMTQRGN